MTPKFHPLRIAEVRREAVDAVSISFEVPESLLNDYRFTQGQHLTLRTHIDGEELRRSYSICSGVNERPLRVAIREVPGGVFSTFANRNLRAGDAIDVMTPDGRFFTKLDAQHRKHYVAFAAGSGITPVLSTLKTTLEKEPLSRFTLVYGNRKLATTMFSEELEDIKDRYLDRFTLIRVFSRERQDIDMFNGRIDGAKVKQLLDTLVPATSIDEAFICGPGMFIDEVASALQACGVGAEHIHVERFGVPVNAEAPRDDARDAAHATIGVIIDGLRREVDYFREDHSILDAAIRAGIDLPFSCKGGMCCTCRAKIVEGEVRMEKNYSLDQKDVAAGFALTCQSHPVTERVVVSYDER